MAKHPRMPLEERSYMEWMDESQTQRQGHLLALHGESIPLPEGRMGKESTIQIAFASFLAWKHLEERRSDILPQLPTLLKECPELHWTYQARDTLFSPQLAVQHLLDAMNNHNNNTKPPPYAMLGGIVGAVAGPLGIVGSALGIPLISGTAFSPREREEFDLTTRTILNVGDGQGQAALQYMRSLGVSHMAFLYPDLPCCTPLESTFKKMEQDQGITVLPIPYDPLNVSKALSVFKESQYQYVFLVVHLSSQFDSIVLETHRQGLAGPNSNITWIHCEHTEILDPSFALPRNNTALLEALHGSAFIAGSTDVHDAFASSLQQMQTNTTLQQEFLSIHHHQPSFQELAYNFSTPIPDHPFYHSTFDAVIALGLAACNSPGLLTGKQLYDNLLNLDFDGVSGRIAFDQTTHLRDSQTFEYNVYNFRFSPERSDHLQARFDAPLVAKINGNQVYSFLEDNNSYSNDSPSTTCVNNIISTCFVYANNSTITPPALPPLDPNDIDLHLIPKGVQIYGCLIAGFIMMLSLALIVWTIRHRKTFAIRSAQPAFLVPICVGTFLMASAAFPFSLQASTPEEAQERHLHTACVLTPWLIYVGFVITVSALFSKTWRINTLTKSGRNMQRLILMPHHVILPFIVLLILNVSVLTAWTILDDYQYIRIPSDYDVDVFNRSLSSYGACRSSSSTNVHRMYHFLMPLAAIDLGMVLVATYECYKARNLPDELAETKHLALSMASFLETLILGGPILLVTRNNPTAYFAVGTTLLCICCLAFLVPIFVPKYVNIRRKSSGMDVSSRCQRASSNRTSNRTQQHPPPAMMGSSLLNPMAGSSQGLQSPTGSSRVLRAIPEDSFQS